MNLRLCGSAVQFDDGKELASIWDYDPPKDLAGSGAWNVLRELATTLSRYIALGRPDSSPGCTVINNLQCCCI